MVITIFLPYSGWWCQGNRWIKSGATLSRWRMTFQMKDFKMEYCYLKLYIWPSKNDDIMPLCPYKAYALSIGLDQNIASHSRISMNSEVGITIISGSAELVIQRRLWIQIPVSEFRDGGSLNSDTLLLFWISALTETFWHSITTRYVQELFLMFTKNLSVQIIFLSVQFSSNGFGICKPRRELGSPYAYYA